MFPSDVTTFMKDGRKNAYLHCGTYIGTLEELGEMEYEASFLSPHSRGSPYPGIVKGL